MKGLISRSSSLLFQTHLICALHRKVLLHLLLVLFLSVSVVYQTTLKGKNWILLFYIFFILSQVLCHFLQEIFLPARVNIGTWLVLPQHSAPYSLPQPLSIFTVVVLSLSVSHTREQYLPWWMAHRRVSLNIVTSKVTYTELLLNKFFIQDY